MPQLKHFKAGTDIKKWMPHFEEDGAVIIDNVLKADEVDEILGDLMPYIDATEHGRDDFAGKKTRRTGALAARSKKVQEIILHPMIMAGCKDFLTRECSNFLLHLTQTICIGPGQGAQEIHRDRWAWEQVTRDWEPQFSTIWALTDFTNENGATQVAPGSPRWPNDRFPSQDQITQAEMKKGSVLLYTGSVLHGGGENKTKENRIGMNITYCQGWLRTEENNYLSYPPHIAKDFPPELQALIGYKMGAYALGYYTPPLPPGEGPESVPPEYALSGDDTAYWGDNNVKELMEKAKAG